MGQICQPATSRVHVNSSLKTTRISYISPDTAGSSRSTRATIFDPFSTHQNTRIPHSIDVVWIQGVRGNGEGEAVTERHGTRVQRTVFQVRVSRCHLHPRSPFSLTPCLYPRVHHSSPFPIPRPCRSSSPSRLSCSPHTRPPVSLPSLGAILLAPPCEPSELSEPLWISPYATYWAQDVLRAYVSGICERAEWTRLSDVAFINIATGSFCVSIYQFHVLRQSWKWLE